MLINNQYWDYLDIEELDIDINLSALQAWAMSVRKNYWPVWQGQWEKSPTQGTNEQLKSAPEPRPIGDKKYIQAYGGWSVQTFDKSYVQGWQPAQRFKDSNNNIVSKPVVPDIKQTYYTEIATQPVIDTIEKIKELGLTPHRARLALLMPGHELGWHWDQGICAQNTHVFKIHIPIITNEHNTFESRDCAWNLKAGKVYAMNVNHEHNATNNSNQERYHLVMNAIDTNKITKRLHA